MVYAREACLPFEVSSIINWVKLQPGNHDNQLTTSHGYEVDEGAGLQACSAQPSNGARHQVQYSVVAGGLHPFQWSASQISGPANAGTGRL